MDLQTFVLDTNILLDSPTLEDNFSTETIIIPFEVICELENQKTRHDLVGKNAREVLFFLDSLKGDLLSGVQYSPSGGKLFISPPCDDMGGDSDWKILSVAKQKGSTLITNDVAMRVKASIMGVPCESFSRTKELEIDYCKEVSLSIEKRSTLFSEKRVEISEKLFPNQMVLTEGGVGIYRNGLFHLLEECGPMFGISPRNKEQKFAVNILKNESIPLVSLTGPAGCGKTLLSMASALEMTIERKKYEKIIITRPIQPLGKDLGFLPGTLEEKMAPWIQPLKDALSVILKGNKRNLSFLFETGVLEIQALSYIRGRSLPNVFMIVDEAQNLSVPEIKSIVTRIGEGSKLVFTGDLNQIDTNRCQKTTNGLFHLIDRMKNSNFSSHIHLQKGERSGLATEASNLL